MLKEIWHSGCRKALLDFTRCLALLTQKISVLHECIHDLDQVSGRTNVNKNNFQSSQELFNLLKEFISPIHMQYSLHIINIIFQNQEYSPLFDFASQSIDMSCESNFTNVIREMEGFNFTEFVQANDAKTLVAIGGFLHISREILDFLDNFHKVTDQDCTFLSECFVKFTEESETMIKVATFLTGLSKMAHFANSAPQINKVSYQDNTYEAAEVNNEDIIDTTDNSANITLVDSVDGPTSQKTKIEEESHIGANSKTAHFFIELTKQVDTVSKLLLNGVSAVHKTIERGSTRVTDTEQKYNELPM